MQLTKTVITTPPTLPAEGYVGNEYIDEALQGGEAKAEGTGDVFPAHSALSTMEAAESYARAKTAWKSSLPQRYGGIHHGGMHRHRDRNKAHDHKSPRRRGHH